MMKRSWLAEKFESFIRDDSGVQLVEFAFAAPVLLVLLGGISHVSISQHTSSQVSKVTATVADIISQSPAVNKFAVSSAFSAARAMLSNSDQLSLVLTGVQVDSGGNSVVLWSTGNKNNLQHITVAEPGEEFDLLPQGLKNTAGFVIVTQGFMPQSNGLGKMFDYTPAAGTSGHSYMNFFVPRVSILTLCEACEL